MALSSAAPCLDFGRRRQYRRHVPHHRGETLGSARATGRGGQQTGRGDRSGHGGSGESAARRLHLSRHHHELDGGQSRAARQSPLRPGEGLRAGDPDQHRQRAPYRARGCTIPGPEGLRRMGEEARAAGELRVDRCRHLAAPLRRDPGEGVRRAAQPRPLQGRGSGDHRRDERDARRGLGEHPDREASGHRGKSPSARDHRPQALRRLAGARHFRRAGLPRIRDAGLGRRLPARGNAQAHRRAALARDRGSPENARGRGTPEASGAKVE